MLWVGDGEDCTRRVDGPRPEADQQLVHQPEETALEALGGHAFRDDGRLSPTERRCALLGWPVHGWWHVPPWFVNCSGPFDHIVGIFLLYTRMRCDARTLLWNFFCYRLGLVSAVISRSCYSVLFQERFAYTYHYLQEPMYLTNRRVFHILLQMT